MTKPNADKDVEKLNHSYIAGGDKKLYSYSVKTTWQFLIKLKIELPYTPAIPLIHSKALKAGLKQISLHPCS